MIDSFAEKRLNGGEAYDKAMKAVRDTLMSAPRAVRDITEHLASSLGKGIRMRLLIACAMDEEGFVTPDAVAAAASIELVHTATLVHDDIIDEADIRRDIPAAHSKFGTEKAVLCGDWLLCAALKQAAAMELPHRERENASDLRNLILPFLQAAEKICLGELEERDNIGNLELSPRRYLRVIDGKTAALFRLSARVGAFTGGAGDRKTKLLVSFARYYGYMFQIADDIKNYTSEKPEMLKTVRNDLLSGVVTMPVILGFLRNPALKDLAGEVMRGEYGLEPFIRRLREAKGIEAAAEICGRYAAKARAIMNTLEPEPMRVALAGLVNDIIPIEGR